MRSPMKSSAKSNAVRLVLCVGFFVAIFHKSLGLPEWTADAGVLLGFLSAVTLLWMQIRAKKRGEAAPDPAAVKRGTWIALALIVIVTLSSPFWLPYTGITLGFPQLAASAFVSCVMGIAALLLGVWFRRRV
jgi:peptidoglycan biosynthesis protein MviN/MurJ (putative lipid II flippase)